MNALVFSTVREVRIEMEKFFSVDTYDGNVTNRTSTGTVLFVARVDSKEKC